MPRRGILKKGAIGGGAVFGGLVIIGGLASETGLIEDPQDDDDSEGETSGSTEANDGETSSGDNSTSEMSQTRDMLRDERLHTQTRWPHEFEAGDTLYVTIEVDESGPAGFTIFHDEERDVGESWIVELEDIIEYEIELDGLHQLVVDPNGVVDVVIEVERGP